MLVSFREIHKFSTIHVRSGAIPRIPLTGRGVPSMCDYSLHHVATRPAQIEDKLVTTKFSNSITRGFSAVWQPPVAKLRRSGRRTSLARLRFRPDDARASAPTRAHRRTYGAANERAGEG